MDRGAAFHYGPPLPSYNLTMSARLGLRPEIAGITLLALGNGAPDIFTALAGISGAHDFELVAGELLGASNFISTVVLAAVLRQARRGRARSAHEHACAHGTKT